MRDPKELDTGEQDLDDAGAEAMRDEEIRVNGVQLVDKDLKHWPLTREHLDV